MDNHIYITVMSIYDTMCSILHPGRGEELSLTNCGVFYLYF